MSFSGRGVVELAGQRRRAPAAQAVAHDQDFADLELADSEFERGRHAMEPAARFIRRREFRDIAHDEHLSRTGVEYLRWIDPAVGARQDHDLRALALGQLGPAFALARPAPGAEAVVAFDQFA